MTQLDTLMATRRVIDGPEARRQIAEMRQAGATKSAQVKMARLALRLALLTDDARTAWREVAG